MATWRMRNEASRIETCRVYVVVVVVVVVVGSRGNHNDLQTGPQR